MSFNRNRLFIASVIIFIGILLMIDNLGIADLPNLWPFFWPGLMIFMGVLILLNQAHFKKIIESFDKLNVEKRHDNDITIFFSETRQSINQPLEASTITVAFGSAKIDLNPAVVSNPPAVINLTVIFGEVKLAVPPDWNIRLDVTTLLGESRDQRPYPTIQSDNDQPDLIITGIVTLSSFDIL